MSLPSPFRPSRAFDFRLGFGIPIALMVLFLVFEPVDLDFAIAHAFYDSSTTEFIGRHSFLLEEVLYRYAKRALSAFAAIVLICFFLSFFLEKLRPWCRTLGYLVLSLILSIGIIPPLKKLTDIPCPWGLTTFGGTEVFSTLLEPRPPTEKQGRCWPAGHSSAGFSLMAFFFALRDHRPRAARLTLIIAISLGGVFALARMMQGAHFLSHGIWTFLIDWTTCLLCYRLLLYRR